MIHGCFTIPAVQGRIRVTEPIQLSKQGKHILITCPNTGDKLKITLAQAETLYRSLRVIVKAKKAA